MPRMYWRFGRDGTARLLCLIGGVTIGAATDDPLWLTMVWAAVAATVVLLFVYGCFVDADDA